MTPLDKFAKEITTLGSHLANILKSKNSVDRVEELKKALKLASDADWDGLVKLLEVESMIAKEAADQELSERRQKMLETAKSKGVHYRADSEADTVDVFKVRFKGRETVTEFAGVEVECFRELDGVRLAEAIIELRKRLEKASLDRNKFFALTKSAIESAHAKNPTRDGYVDFISIYKELVFELAWSKSSFAKTGAAKHFPDYPFYQFLWDLAAFIGGGNAEGGYRLVGRTPAMSERATSYRLPSLLQPSAQGEVLHMLRVQKQD
jgi:hypothetical protein